MKHLALSVLYPPVFPQQRQHELSSQSPGNHPTGGGTQQQGQTGRSPSPYLEVPLMRSMSHFLGGFDMSKSCGLWVLLDEATILLFRLATLSSLDPESTDWSGSSDWYNTDWPFLAILGLGFLMLGEFLFELPTVCPWFETTLRSFWSQRLTKEIFIFVSISRVFCLCVCLSVRLAVHTYIRTYST